MRYGRVRFRRYGGLTFKIVCALVIFAVAFLLTDAKLRPAVLDIAAVEAKAVADKKVNTAVEKAKSGREIT